MTSNLIAIHILQGRRVLTQLLPQSVLDGGTEAMLGSGTPVIQSKEPG